MAEMTTIERMRLFEPVRWDLIPDLGLYMDQVINYIDRQFGQIYGAATRGLLTPAMINNYVKSGLIPRPNGKKYDREHLAMLMMVVPLKQVCSIEDVKKLIRVQEMGDLRALYERFCAAQTAIMRAVAEKTAEASERAGALDFAIEASACRLACEALLPRDAAK